MDTARNSGLDMTGAFRAATASVRQAAPITRQVDTAGPLQTPAARQSTEFVRTAATTPVGGIVDPFRAAVQHALAARR